MYVQFRSFVQRVYREIQALSKSVINPQETYHLDTNKKLRYLRLHHTYIKNFIFEKLL